MVILSLSLFQSYPFGVWNSSMFDFVHEILMKKPNQIKISCIFCITLGNLKYKIHEKWFGIRFALFDLFDWFDWYWSWRKFQTIPFFFLLKKKIMRFLFCSHSCDFRSHLTQYVVTVHSFCCSVTMFSYIACNRYFHLIEKTVQTVGQPNFKVHSFYFAYNKNAILTLSRNCTYEFIQSLKSNILPRFVYITMKHQFLIEK